ncbi:MAG: DUF4093 domain-containing protein [Clostridia bacterium]|nr:DUF4093 domain-containing protein [Clostridia bacterium]
MIKINEAVIVEGKYDKIKLESVIDAPIIVTNGFEIFKDKQNKELIKKLALKRGVVIMTDSDSAGFLIRSHLKGYLPKDKVKHAYIPDVLGKEKRKTKASAEGKLGVEGVSVEEILLALKRAGVTASESESVAESITKVDLFEAGLSGGTESKSRRLMLLKHLQLPERMTGNAMLDVLNVFLTKQEFFEIVNELFGGK